jgi:beta-mannosidase
LLEQNEYFTQFAMTRLLHSTLIIGLSIFFITFCTKVNQAQTTRIVSLNEDWHFQPASILSPPKDKDLGQNINPDGYKTQLPNTALNALFENGAIEDPFYRTNEERLQWLEKKDWVFEKTFDADEKLLKKEKIDLILRGVDTYADVYLNDVLIQKTDNAFRTWRLEVKNLLKHKGNVLKFLFTSPLSKEKILADDALVDYPDVYNTTRVYTRKPQYQYGWDWGPRFVSCGLQSAELQSWDMLRLEDTHIKQVKLTRERADMEAHLTVFSTADTSATVNIVANGKTFSRLFYVNKGSNEVNFEFEILYPSYWWSHDLGTPFLYTIEVNIENHATIFDQKKVKIGLRTLELVTEKDAKGESFYFKLNGYPIFAKGANYIPENIFLERVKHEHHLRTIQSAVDANMNMLRVWGGGVYETDDFYNICDEKGLLVWQDFMYACAMYPGDEKFLQNAEIEAVEQVKRLRNHPSIALWCGNNEINEAWHNWGWQPRFNPDQKEYIWNAYKTLFNKILPTAVKENASQTAYWESSPRLGRYNDKSYTEGDSHDWFVWHDERPFEHFEQKIPRFMSEYGFQSFPEWRTIESFTKPEDRELTSEVMLLHQKHPKGNQLIKKYMAQYFKVPKTFKDFVYVSQLLQAEGIGKAIEAQRRAKPYCMGTLYWQLNDVWPVASWSSIDNFGRWKALHHKVKEVYQPVLLSPVITKDEFQVYIVNDSLVVGGNLRIHVYDFTGKNLLVDGKEVVVKTNSSELQYSISIKNMLADLGSPQNVYVVLTLLQEGKAPIERVVYLVPPKDLELMKMNIIKEVSPIEGGFQVKLKAAYLMKNVYLYANTEGVFDKNYFDILPNREAVIVYKTTAKFDDFVNSLEVRSLVDTY